MAPGTAVSEPHQAPCQARLPIALIWSHSQGAPPPMLHYTQVQQRRLPCYACGHTSQSHNTHPHSSSALLLQATALRAR
jgi:hypothetical protein